jgi:hypothetical protein
VQLCDRIGEAIAVDEVVPVGDQVAERTAVVAERDAAVHAAGALLAQLGDGTRKQELLEVVRALQRIALRDSVSLDLQKAAELAHQAPVPPTASSGRSRPSELRCAPFSAADSASACASASSRSTRR